VPPPPSHGASSPDCLILQRALEDAHVGLERQRERQNYAVQNLAKAGRNNRAPVNVITTYGGGC
jgi:predicted O-methyltransferase YrrM